MPELLPNVFSSVYFQELQELNIRATRFKLLKIISDEKLANKDALPSELGDEAVNLAQELKYFINMLFLKVLSVSQKGELPNEELVRLQNLRNSLMHQVTDAELEEFVIMVNRFFALVVEARIGYSPHNIVQGL